MFKHCFIFLGLCLGLPFTPANGTPLPVTDVKAMGISEVVVKGGNFYVGSVFGSEDYAAHANTSIASFAITKTEITYRQYHALQEWADTHGYELSGGCNGATFEDCLPPEQDNSLHPVTNVSWWDAVIFANVLSERQQLQPYYLTIDGKTLKRVPEDDNDKLIRENPQASGYRLPTLAEWQVAARGGKKGLAQGTYGQRYAGSEQPDSVAHFPSDSQSFGTVPVASKRPNALGLYDMSGNVSEWLNESYAVEGGKTMYYFCGGSYLERTHSLASCDLHTPGFFMPDIGFRLVRTLDGQ
ncbi:spore coat protein CotH [Pectobacterium brasiliense]|uniref:formylglycine-generating enzyme family protein n=2 Tax=Pectobacterium brasiliense TaxID=180957 RepID=UPI00057E08F8|nr:formylglycine-generating enzyme family protein [Pectobacterium brasiliense]ARA74648.1 spore coat protein CotH [Pectobacterium brasiliense]KHS70611.1 spore coat protein CotH [Pectobacterium brasiliense]KHS88938.1 spore coat protein CotH [Pectobacterium brasiliense]KHS97843.1 spore coat protein CotH [Pectobacterium brasiliense]KHT15888.1 spore coat protein CotH [Pectobacterium brasiliense]